MKKHDVEVPLGPPEALSVLGTTGWVLVVRMEVASELSGGRCVGCEVDLMKLPYEEGAIVMSSSLNGTSRDV